MQCDRTQPRKKREIGKRGKTENWSNTVARGVVESFGTNGSNKRLSLFHCKPPQCFCLEIFGTVLLKFAV